MCANCGQFLKERNYEEKVKKLSGEKVLARTPKIVKGFRYFLAKKEAAML